MFGSRPRPAAVSLALLISALLAAFFAAHASGAVRLEETSGFESSLYSSSSSGKSASLTITRPAGVQPGDVMLAGVTARLSSSGRITAPNGWTQIRRDSNIGGTALTQALYYKVADSSDFGPFTWRFSSMTGVAGGIVAFHGVDPNAPVRALSLIHI